MLSLNAPILTDLLASLTALSPAQTTAMLLSAGAGVISAIVARRKARSGYRWFILGMLLNIIGLIAIMLLPSKITHARCPQCHGIVPIDAPVCMYCKLPFVQPKTRWEKLKKSIAV